MVCFIEENKENILYKMFEYSFKKVERHLRYGYISAAGRNFTGIICVHHNGGGNKRRGYKVDFFRRIIVLASFPK